MTLKQEKKEIAKTFLPVFLYNFMKKVYKYFGFLKDYKHFKKLFEKSEKRFIFSWSDRYPQLYDKTSNTPFDGHYIYHPAWAARILSHTKPEVHYDISSTLTFSTIVSSFIKVVFIDYRPAKLKLSNLSSEAGDLLRLQFNDNSIQSLSCMHVIEHIGLGRYGDPLDPNGDVKAINEIKRVLQEGGDFLLVLPIGTPKIQFNAHRIYSFKQIINMMGEDYKLEAFDLLPDDYTEGLISIPESIDLSEKQNYGCGCFWFKKIR